MTELNKAELAARIEKMLDEIERRVRLKRIPDVEPDVDYGNKRLNDLVNDPVVKAIKQSMRRPMFFRTEADLGFRDRDVARGIWKK